MFWTVTLSLLQGMRQAAVLFGLTLAFSLPLGLPVALGSMSRCRPVRAVFDALVWVIRGTPLVVKRIVPPMGNEFITLVKDTSLARIIAIVELTKAGEDYVKTAGITWPLFYTGVYYLLFVGLLTLLFRYLERRLSYFR